MRSCSRGVGLQDLQEIQEQLQEHQAQGAPGSLSSRTSRSTSRTTSGMILIEFKKVEGSYSHLATFVLKRAPTLPQRGLTGKVPERRTPERRTQNP